MSTEARPVMLELDRVSLTYQTGKRSKGAEAKFVLKDVSLKLYEGESLGIVGRNGVGKTTMLRLMARILAPSRGNVTIHPGKSAALLTLGLGFKNDLSGRDNSMLAGMLQGASQKEAESYLDEIQEFSELGEAFDAPVKSYSAGMKARLGFTTALMTHVDILLIDEVLSVGDAQFRMKATEAMKNRITGDQTVVFVSHMEEQIKELCDRVVWLEHGEVEADGDVDEVMSVYGQKQTGQRIDRIAERILQDRKQVEEELARKSENAD